MKYPRAYILGRILFGFFFLLSSLYCLLAYIPFTFQQVIKGRLLPPLNAFGAVHSFLSVAVLGLSVLLLSFDRKQSTRLPRATRKLRLAFLLLLLIETGFLCWHPVLANIDNGNASYVWSLVAFVPVLWLGIIDWCELLPTVGWQAVSPDENRTHFRAACWTAVFLTVLYGVIAYAPRGGIPGLKATPQASLFAFGVSALTHLLAIILFFVALNLVMVIAGWFGKPSRAQFILCHLFGVGLLWMAFRGIVFPGMAFQGWRADLYALAFALTAAICSSGLCLRLYSRHGGELQSGFAFAFWQMPQAREGIRKSGRWTTPLSLALLAGLAAAIAIATARMDWNYLLQKLTALVVWVAAFRIFYVAASRSRNMRNRTVVLLLCSTGVLFGYRTLQVTQNHLWTLLKGPQTSAQLLQNYAGYNASFKLIYDAIAPAATQGGFYSFLTQNTNIPRSTRIDPVAVNLVDNLARTDTPKPNIFVVVVDSLRRDYVSPYNSAVDFTPKIGEFASESIVMQNAFTHYGGTGLSEPSIWVGGMMIHKQYVTPFAPMNSLQKLLETDRYHSFVTRDTILTTVVAPSPSLTELDESTANMNYDLCTSLDELEGKLQSQPAGHPPLFAYTQPQNVHISVINREGARSIDNGNYRNFYAPYASRMRKIDGCFGNFVASLKKLGLYDNSIVILTADHGDSLGEQGRWGHAYTIYPEILRIPLIIHLPPAIRQKLYAAPNAIAFSTDITPSLYYILGHKPAVNNEMFGHPLFTERAGEQVPYHRDSYLVASSYGAAYGILSGDGKSLFVSDAVNYKDYWFDLTTDDSGGSSVNGSTKAKFQAKIRERILAINHFYKYAGGDVTK
jgi:arylsulfatase A-like enzyme